MEVQNLKVLAGVVTYNPELSRLKENLATLVNQVDELYIFDNGSDNVAEIENLLDQYARKIVLHKEGKNAGIAFALKNIMKFAKECKFDWVLSVDQDSVLDSHLVDKYKTEISKHKNDDIGMLTCLIKDRNFEDASVEKQEEDVKEVPICITSAALTNVKNYFLTSGYDSELFIDLVDTDICLSLREKGFKILRINYLGIYHEIGHGVNKKILWKNVIVHNSNIFREYYMARNTIILQRKHPNVYSRKTMIKGLSLNFLIIVLFEKDKLKRLRNYFRGIQAGKVRS
ncbi:glycosyltransferase family 2 protein [Lactobacillus johnsonii]|uniref:glycosyltransferase family 2 protein n=1 Tax=Lactobacillus johnsonii TaxID=33959 RepID=UPI003DA1EC17